MSRFCTQCGSPLNDGMAFCTQCGSPVQAVSENNQASSAVSTATPTTADVSANESTAQLDDATVVLGQAATTQVIEQAPAVQTPTNQPPAYQTPSVQGQAPVAQMPMGQAPLIQTPVIQTPGADMPGVGVQQNQKKKSKAPLIIGIVIAVIVIAAAVAVGFFVLNQDASSSSSDTSASADGSAEEKSSADSTPVTYKVTYQTNGGSTIDAITVDKGKEIPTPQTPTRTDYTFAGWYLDSGFSQAASFPLKVEADITLYAKWDDPKSASEVSISVVGRDGTTKTATIHREGKTGRVFPDSNTVELTEAQVKALSDAERCVAWNEIIAAANGYEFKNSGLKNYFTNYCAWYTPKSGGSSSVTGTAQKNVDLLKRYTDSWWLNLATN